MKICQNLPFKSIEIAHQIILMSDGCRLSARIWMPENALEKPVPAIVEHLPYRKRDGTIARDELTHPWFAGHGFACIRVDMRGNGDSEGLMEDEYTQQELDDACEVIAWVSAQPFCTGSVGMMGISWGGFNSLQVAAMRPPALKAIITLCSTVDRFADDIHYKGGCLLGENIGWAANMLSYSSRPPDPMLAGESWRELWMDRLENMPFLASNWLKHQHRNEYWKHGSVCEDYAAIDAAVLSIGGWHDGYRNTISHLVENLDAPVKGIVGPWIHKYPHYAAPQPAIGFLQEAKRWWDRWLKDEQNGAEYDPAYRVWLMDSIEPARWLPERPGRWIGEQQWPSEQIVMQGWILTKQGHPLNKHEHEHEHQQDRQILAGEGFSRQLRRISIDGKITAGYEFPEKEKFKEPIASSQACGQSSGEYFPFAYGPELPDEQSIDDNESVCFDSAALADITDIVGAPVVNLTVMPDGSAANVCVRLCDVGADGKSALITLGVINLKHAQSFEQPQTITPDEPMEVSITLDQIAYRLPVGHRLRIAVSTAYWPFIWPAPGLGSISLLSGNLSLPCRQIAATSLDNVSFEPPEGTPPWQAQNLRPASSTRKTSVDAQTGMLSTKIDNDFGENRDLQHGLVSGSQTHELWVIDPADPLSAEVNIQWEQNGGRDEWSWSTSVSVTMHCDENHFYVSGYLRACEANEIIFEAEYADTIPRQFV